MRFNGVVLGAALAVIGACGGGDKGSADTTSSAAATPAAGASTGAATTAAGAKSPVTGTWHEVKMVGDEKGYRFEPQDLTIKSGDGVRWTMISGGPHNVAFQNVTGTAKSQLSANMENQISDLSSPMLLNPNEKYEVSFAKVPAGKYDYICTPHIANNMRGSITVQ